MNTVIRKLLIVVFTFFSLAAHAEGPTNMPQVKLETSLGDIVIQLNEEKAPKTVANFLSYVDSGFYDGTIFHRVIEGFMIQGGGFDENFHQKSTNSPIENEADNGLTNKRGSLAMARTNDPHSATAQFFINVVDNDFLNFRSKDMSGWGYAVFAEVVDGMDVVDKIRDVATKNHGPHQNVPVENVVIISASRLD
jgi:peptidyl-prolyl cis-trans isomerase B (cyclophilin B)